MGNPPRGSGLIEVEVAYALPDRQRLVVVQVPPGTRVREVLARSGLTEMFPEIDSARCPVGVFGKEVDDAFTPAAGDRVEVYRPLRMDPRQARRARAASSTNGG